MNRKAQEYEERLTSTSAFKYLRSAPVSKAAVEMWCIKAVT